MAVRIRRMFDWGIACRSDLRFWIPRYSTGRCEARMATITLYEKARQTRAGAGSESKTLRRQGGKSCPSYRFSIGSAPLRPQPSARTRANMLGETGDDRHRDDEQ